MTKKRFEIVKSAIIDGARVIKDNEKKYTFATTFETATLINYRKALNELNDENEQLKSRIQYLERKIGRERNSHIKQHEKWEKEIKDENDQLKQRNNRQAKQLDRLYNLIEEKDWRTLTDILDDFKRCEEQLQKEWGTYGDVE